MKKIVSLLLVTLMILSAFTLCFSSSAEEAVKAPAFPASESMMASAPTADDKTRVHKYCFYALAGGMQANGGLADKDYTSALNSEGKSFNISLANVDGKGNPYTIAIDGTQKDNGYSGIIGFKLTDGTKKSIILTVPSSGHANGDKVPKAIDFYTSDEFWGECAKDKYNVPATSSSTRPFTLVLSLTGLEDKWIESSDGAYRYYQVDFPQAFTDNYLTVAFPNCGEATGKACMYEIAVFGSALPTAEPTNSGATDPTNSSATDPTNSSATNPTTGDSFTLMTVLSLGAVLTAAAVVVKVRKKED